MGNPFNYNLAARPHEFVGSERRRLVSDIAASVRDDRGNSYLVVGGRRFGKTSVLLNIWYAAMSDRRVNENDYATLPVYVNAASIADLAGGRGLYSAILREILYALHDDPRPRDAPPCPFRVNSSAVRWPDLSEPSTITHDVFAGAICEIAAAAEPKYGKFRVVLLLDEVERFLDKNWTADFFGHLRSLIHDPNQTCQPHLCCVVAGSHRIYSKRTTNEPGSPFLNVLSPHLLSVLDDESTMELISRFDGLSDRVKQCVLVQSGGHPFLAQFLLHELWKVRDNRGGAGTITEADVVTAAQGFMQTRRADLEGWLSAVGDIGQRVYGILASRSRWMDLNEIRSAIRPRNSSVQEGLEALAYHGLIRINPANPRCYRIAGDLFREWVRDYGDISIETDPESSGVYLLDIEHWMLESYELIRSLEPQTQLYASDDPLKLKRLESQIEQHWAQVKRRLKEYLEICTYFDHPIPADIKSIALRFLNDPEIGSLVHACLLERG